MFRDIAIGIKVGACWDGLCSHCYCFAYRFDYQECGLGLSYKYIQSLHILSKQMVRPLHCECMCTSRFIVSACAPEAYEEPCSNSIVVLKPEKPNAILWNSEPATVNHCQSKAKQECYITHPSQQSGRKGHLQAWFSWTQVCGCANFFFWKTTAACATKAK